MSTGSLTLPVPPPAIAGVAYRHKMSTSGLHFPFVKSGDVVKVGEPLIAWGGSSLAWKDFFFGNITSILLRRDVTESRLLSPVTGIIEWVNSALNVNTDWQLLNSGLKIGSREYDYQNAIRIRVTNTRKEDINLLSAYSELIAYARRHARKSERERIEQEINIIKKAELIFL
ncbi:MAG: hypothetical protein M0R33_19670 [Methylomonas sp.]|jgi:hypothetical protein|uniref:hypothetical protein n=1 Tax=Methylomonas sp. TaxID=418 RepID=UPI0025F60EE8|nr:hypothetical protein [Methylomonas sp.]MCK9608665.1 hypothetical protein [Methylomonas sp.]